MGSLHFDRRVAGDRLVRKRSRKQACFNNRVVIGSILLLLEASQRKRSKTGFGLLRSVWNLKVNLRLMHLPVHFAKHPNHFNRTNALGKRLRRRFASVASRVPAPPPPPACASFAIMVAIRKTFLRGSTNLRGRSNIPNHLCSPAQLNRCVSAALIHKRAFSQRAFSARKSHGIPRQYCKGQDGLLGANVGNSQGRIQVAYQQTGKNVALSRLLIFGQENV